MTMTATVATAVLAHARESWPHECCGLLVGSAMHIASAVRARNLAEDTAQRFVIDPHDHFEAIRTARRRGEQVIGAYHSHPRSGASPSRTDAAGAFTDFIWVIVGLGTEPPELAAWKWTDGNFSAVPLVRVP